jgi:hypothetical protein
MRTLAFAAAALLSSGAAALAAPASVTVSVGPELQTKAEKTYGVRAVNELAERLRDRVDRRLAADPSYEGARVELVLVDAAPTKPTMKQISDRPGLSYFHSVSAGGAEIGGRVVRADGSVTPIQYRYFETFPWARAFATWGDAESVFERFTHQLARGERLAMR